MAITGIDTIDGKQIIAAGAISAKSAEMAYNDENGNPITGYQVAGDYYSASNPSGFITGVDLTSYQTVEGMTAYQPAGSYLTTADSANFYTTANESGFISEVPVGTMNESAFGYDANDKISGYNGSAFAGGGSEFPESATEAIETVTSNSADWNGTTETVSSNSGAWGGSALPISAGPGIRFEMIDNTLVASTDETVLYDDEINRPTTVGSQIQLSESPLNFEYIEVYLNGSSPTGTTNLANAYGKFTDEYITQVNTLMFNGDFIADSSYTHGTIWHMGCAYNGVSSTTWTKVYGYAHPITSFPSDWFTNNTHLNIYKIVGINRK